MKRHPDIKVELQPVASYSDYHSKLLAQLTSNTAPDVFYIGDDKIGQFVDAKVLMPLTELMESDASQTQARRLLPGPLRRRRDRTARSTPPRTTRTPTCSGTTRSGARGGRHHRGPRRARRERRVDHREVPRDERQARGRGPHRLDVLELLGHALQLDLVAGRHRLRRVGRIRRQRRRDHGRGGRHARQVLPGRHIRRRRHDARGRRSRQRLRDAQGRLLLAGPLHDRHGRERGRAGQLRHRALADARRPGGSDRRRHLVPRDQRQDRRRPTPRSRSGPSS